MLQEKIKVLAGNFLQEFIEIRNHLHAHPELSYEEYNTSAFIQKKLAEMGVPFQIMATTGVIGSLEGKNSKKRIIALRADIDALPITEENDVEYKSKSPGIMHACGHDVHTTCLLGAAKILSELKDQWEGTIKLIFQPGEEKNPGGASLLIKEGVLENPAPEAILGLHVHPSLEVGKFSFRGGMTMASADEIYIKVKGKGGHAAAPHKTVDTILAASQLIVNLQQVVSRMNNPLNPSVLSITAINGGNTTNVIPSEVKLMGTFRAMNEEWRFEAHQLIKNICKHTGELTGAKIEADIDVGYPFLYNNEELTRNAMEKAVEFVGSQNVSETELRMGAEDFAYYSQKIPACFYRLGVANPGKKTKHEVHTSTFNINEDAIKEGMAMMAWLATQVNPG